MRAELAIAAVVLAARAAAASPAPATAFADDLLRQQFAEWSATLASGTAPTTSVFTPGARFAVTGGLGVQDEVAPATAPSELFGNVVLAATVTDTRASIAGDGTAAWITFAAILSRTSDHSLPLTTIRGTEIAVKQGKGWMIAGGMLSIGHPDAEVTKAAAVGKLGALQPVNDAASGSADDAELRRAFDALLATGFSAADVARVDLVTVGSAPRELSVGGKAIGPYFNKVWVGHAKVIGVPLVIAAPGPRSVAGVVANVELPGGTRAKPYVLPFRVLIVFALGADHAWHVAALHLAVPAPK